MSLPSGHRGVERVGQGCEQPDQYYKRDSGFFVVKIQEHFEFRPDWHRSSEVRALVGQYYVVLRSVLRAKAHLRACLTRCRHCRIFFLTDPRNAGRRDLGCPFGCKEAHRKRCSSERSVAYYRTQEGRVKKRIQNGRRGEGQAGVGLREQAVGRRELEREGIRLEAGTVGYLRMVIGLVEGRRVSLQEVVAMLARVLRQHSMARRRRIDYVVEYLKKNAP